MSGMNHSNLTGGPNLVHPSAVPVPVVPSVPCSPVPGSVPSGSGTAPGTKPFTISHSLNTNNEKEDAPMTTRDFLMNLITHCETLPQLIDLDTAAARLRLLDPAQIPSDLTPESFMTTWNDIITNDLPVGNWITPDHSGT